MSRKRPAMTCFVCGAKMKTVRGEHHYTECGLPRVLLVGVEISTCPECGERAVAIPAIESLHKSLAREVANKSSRLAPPEIKFLRKWLGYSGVDFAKLIDVTPETLSRWESATKPKPMMLTAERLLRLMVLTRDPVAEYPLERLAEVATKKSAPARLRAKKRNNNTWTLERAAH